jgi:hypothetical protein
MSLFLFLLLILLQRMLEIYRFSSRLEVMDAAPSHMGVKKVSHALLARMESSKFKQIIPVVFS